MKGQTVEVLTRGDLVTGTWCEVEMSEIYENMTNNKVQKLKSSLLAFNPIHQISKTWKSKFLKWIKFDMILWFPSFFYSLYKNAQISRVTCGNPIFGCIKGSYRLHYGFLLLSLILLKKKKAWKTEKQKINTEGHLKDQSRFQGPLPSTEKKREDPGNEVTEGPHLSHSVLWGATMWGVLLLRVERECPYEDQDLILLFPDVRHALVGGSNIPRKSLNC